MSPPLPEASLVDLMGPKFTAQQFDALDYKTIYPSEVPKRKRKASS